MRTVETEGETIQFSDVAYYALLKAESENLKAFAEHLFSMQRQGFPDFETTVTPLARNALHRVHRLLPQIADADLQESMSLLCQCTSEILLNDETLQATVAQHFRLPPPTRDDNRRQLVDKIDSAISEGGWVDEQYRDTLRPSEAAIHQFRATKQRFDAALAQALKPLSYLVGEIDFLKYPEVQRYFERYR